MDLLKIASELFMQYLAGARERVDVDDQQVQSALGALLGGRDGQLDLADLVAKFSQGGLGALAQSWLGDGANQPLSLDSLIAILGESNLSNFAARLGISKDTAGDGLAQMIPQLIDQNSSGGGLLDAVGGVSGLAGLASRFFK